MSDGSGSMIFCCCPQRAWRLPCFLRRSEQGIKGEIMSEEMLKAEKLQAGYNRHAVLKNVSCSVQKGEMLGIIGPNCAGKSTLLRTLRGMLPCLSGSIRLQDRDIRTLSEREFARRAAYLQQQLNLSFGYTARQIVLAGRYPYLSWWQREGKRDEEIVQACMDYTGVARLANKPMQAMSGGQRQRVLLAKVLAQQTPLLFLDEPATGLDLVYQEEIFRFCRELCAAGKTVLMVVHELSLAARFCSRLLLIAKGKLAADGAPAEVMQESRLSMAYDAPIHVLENPLSGHADIFTGQEDTAEHQRLLERILDCREGEG